MEQSLSPYDWWAIILAVVFLVVINGSYLLYLYFTSRNRKVHDIYGIVFSSIACHFANWGVAEFYLINGYWYLLGYSLSQTVGMLYWTIAWFLAILPVFLMAVMLVFYFLEGYEDVKGGLKGIYGSILGDKAKSMEVLEKYVALLAHIVLNANELFENESKRKIFFKTILSGISGWGVGNILQDRICGLLCLAVVKPEFRVDLWNLYLTFNGNPTGALIEWIIPILLFTFISYLYVKKC